MKNLGKPFDPIVRAGLLKRLWEISRLIDDESLLNGAIEYLQDYAKQGQPNWTTLEPGDRVICNTGRNGTVVSLVPDDAPAFQCVQVLFDDAPKSESVKSYCLTAIALLDRIS